MVERTRRLEVSTNRHPRQQQPYAPDIGYDGSGEVDSDGAYTYTYDAEGRPVAVSGSGNAATANFDAFHRAIETQSGGVTTNILYTPDGLKFGLMNGASIVRYMLPVVAGTQVVFNGSGVLYYGHADWQGSQRLASKADQSMYYDGAYAPFGYSYDENGTTTRLNRSMEGVKVSCRGYPLRRLTLSSVGW